jgi:hypothetical protein
MNLRPRNARWALRMGCSSWSQSSARRTSSGVTLPEILSSPPAISPPKRWTWQVSDSAAPSSRLSSSRSSCSIACAVTGGRASASSSSMRSKTRSPSLFTEAPGFRWLDAGMSRNSGRIAQYGPCSKRLGVHVVKSAEPSTRPYWHSRDVHKRQRSCRTLPVAGRAGAC